VDRRATMPAATRRYKVAALLAVGAALAAFVASARAQPLPIADPLGPPGLGAEAQALWPRFIAYNLHRAFAVGPGGAFGAAGNRRSVDEAKQAALETCASYARGACRLLAVDLAIVDPTRPWSPNPAPPASIGIGGFAWQIVPDGRYLWRGPEQAQGAIVFGHGRSADADPRGMQPQTWVRRFNLSGYDVFRFDRHPNSDDTHRAAGWLREGLAKLRAHGYRQIVVSGQSRGGWNALQVLDTPGLADVAIAIAPAAHGQGGSPNLLAQTDELRTIAGRANAPGARLAFVQFANDPFVLDPEGRARIVRERFAPRLSAVLVIDRPEGLAGHGAGQGTRFADRFGDCLVAFATLPTPPERC